MGKRVEEKGLVTWNQNLSCSESSSIGKNSDLSMEKSSDGEEVQSSYKGPLDSMEALDQLLPIRRGISRFYSGKSKSFTSLADAPSSSSMKELAKPENAYMRRRRNLLGCCLMKSNGGGVSKRLSRTTLGGGSSRATLALAGAMRNSDTEKQAESGEDLSGLRSFSLADLEQCVSVSYKLL